MLKKFVYEDSSYEEKTIEIYERGFLEGTDKDPYVVKGTLIISRYIQFPHGVMLDYMHLICLGLFKSLMKKWFETKKITNKFTDQRARRIADSIRKQLQPEYYLGS